MTEPKGETSQRRKLLGDEPVQVVLKLPAEIHAGLITVASADYESVATVIRRLIVDDLRGRGLIP